QVAHRRGQGAKPVLQLLLQVGHVLRPADADHFLVNLDLALRVRHVIVGDVRVHVQVDDGIRRLLDHLPLDLAHGLLQELAVQLEPDRGNVTVLLRPQQVARSPDLQVPEGDLEARPELGELPDGLQALLSVFGQYFVPAVGEIRISHPVAPPDPAAQLVQLRQPQPVCLVDDERVDVGDVHAGLDDGAAEEHVDLAVEEVQHHPLEQILVHLPVGDADAGLRHQVPQPLAEALDVLHPVVDEIDLPAPGQLPQDGLPYQLF